jgi:hypothetical protein
MVMGRKVFLVFVSGVALAVLVPRIFDSGSSEQVDLPNLATLINRPGTVEADREIYRLREDVARLHARQSTLERQAQRETVPAAAIDSAGADTPHVSPPAPDFADIEARQSRIIESRLTVLEASFEAEKQADPDWAGAMEKQIADVLKSDQFSAGTNLKTARCKATLCVVEFEHDSARALQELATWLDIDGLPRSFMSHQGMDTEGPYRTTAFFARAGYPLPR